MRNSKGKYILMKKVNHACDNSKDDNEHKIYASMAQMSSDDERKSGEYGDSSQLTNWILDSGATCHMTQKSFALHSRIIRRYR